GGREQQLHAALPRAWVGCEGAGARDPARLGVAARILPRDPGAGRPLDAARRSRGPDAGSALEEPLEHGPALPAAAGGRDPDALRVAQGQADDAVAGGGAVAERGHPWRDADALDRHPGDPTPGLTEAVEEPRPRVGAESGER